MRAVGLGAGPRGDVFPAGGRQPAVWRRVAWFRAAWFRAAWFRVAWSRVASFRVAWFRVAWFRVAWFRAAWSRAFQRLHLRVGQGVGWPLVVLDACWATARHPAGTSQAGRKY